MSDIWVRFDDGIRDADIQVVLRVNTRLNADNQMDAYAEVFFAYFAV